MLLNSSSNNGWSDTSFRTPKAFYLPYFIAPRKETKEWGSLSKTQRHIQKGNAKVYLEAAHRKQHFNHTDQELRRLSPQLIFHLRQDSRWC